MNPRLKTLLTSITGVFAAAGGVAGAVAAALAEPKHKAIALSVAVFCGSVAAALGNLGSILAGSRGVAAAAHVEQVTRGTQTVVAADQGQIPAAAPPPGPA